MARSVKAAGLLREKPGLPHATIAKPPRLETDEADVDIVWATEVAYARREERPVDGVKIPAPLNKQDKVGYAIGPMLNGRNMSSAKNFLGYLATSAAQNIYAGYGFLPATAKELKLKAL